ncbi:MAG: hypothetical protein V4645_10135 [Pseudomonadota bacterium]
MKETGILFTAPMVRGVLREVRPKTQTRRGVKWRNVPAGLNLGFSSLAVYSYAPGLYTLEGQRRDGAWERRSSPMRCPYGQPGDRLWGRETFYAWGRWETRFSASKGRDEWHFVDMTLEGGKAYLYAADGPGPQPLGGKRDGGIAPRWWKRPAIFMPRAASRIQLEITSVRVERLLSISEADSLAEGIERYAGPLRWVRYLDANSGEPIHNSAREAYLALWSAINGAGSAADNPWAWAVEFRRLKP